MEDQGYELLQSAAERHDLDPLPSWREVPPETQEHVLRVLRRLALARALDARDGLGVLEREVGIGEDRALRTYLLLTCFEMLGDALPDVGEVAAAGRPEAGDLDLGEPFHEVMSRFLGPSTRSWISTRCWVYRDDSLVAWDGLDEVEPGFSRNNGEDLDRLVRARERWDEATTEERLRLVAAVLRAVMLQYSVGAMPSARNTRSVWGNVGLLRKLADAARADRVNLLSDTAFGSLLEAEPPMESFQGATVILDGDEAFVRRTEIPVTELGAWVEALADWKPRADGGGEALFAWDWGGALAVPDGPAAEHLESWLLEALARLVSDDVPMTPMSAGPGTVDASDAAVA